jgi:hypothetical protein
MHFSSIPIVASALIAITHAQKQYTSTKTSAIEAARATAKTLSPISQVKGKTFDRFVQLWLENTDYGMAAGDCMLPFSSHQ